MPLLEQDIAENQKTPDWVEKNCRALEMDVQNMDNSASRDRECEAMWYADQDPREFDYLTTYGEYELPAVVRFIPLIRPKAMRLIGDYIERPFTYSIFASDKQSLKNKLDNQQDAMMSQISAGLFDRLGNIQSTEQQIQQMLSMQQQQQQPGTPLTPSGTEGQQQIVMPQDQASRLRVYQHVIRQQGLLTQKELAKIEEMSKFTSLEMHEKLAREAVEYLRYTTNLDTIFKEGLEQKLQNDKPYFYVDWETPFEDPTVRRVQSKNFHYAFDDEIDYVQQSEWQCITEYMSIGNVITRFRFDLTPEQRGKLEARRSKFNASGRLAGFNHAGSSWVNGGNGIYNIYTNDPADMCRVRRFFFKSPRAVHFKDVPHRYMPNTTITKMVDETDIPLTPRKDEKYSTFFMNDVYQGILIDGDICIRMGKKPVVCRSVDNFGDVQLPVIGPAVYSKGRRPYSVMWATRDVQKMWNIVHFHKELWIALSGVKTMVMDYSQKPAAMSDTEWHYAKKLGTMYIQTVNPDTGQTATYNQFKDFDAGLGQGYALLIQTADHLDELANKIIGMSPQRMSEISPYDKNGTADKAIRQSALATEYIFYEYDNIRLMVMERLVNLCRLAWKNGKIGSYLDADSMERRIMNIPPGMLYAADYKMHLRSGGIEAKRLDVIRQVALGDKAQERLSMTQLIDIFSIDSMMELKRKCEYYEEESQKLAMQNRQADVDGQKEVEDYKYEKQKELATLQGQIQQEMQKMTDRLKEMEIGLKQKDQEFAQFKLEAEQRIKKAIADDQTRAKVADTESERETEFAYLDEERRQFDITMAAEKSENKDTNVAGPMTINRKRKEKVK